MNTNFIFAMILGLVTALFATPSRSYAGTADYTFRVLGLFDADRTDELRDVVDTIPDVKLVEVDYPAGEATFRFDAETSLPGARNSEPVTTSFDRVLRQASRGTFETHPRSEFRGGQRQKVEIPVAGLDCRGCSYGAYLAVCKIDGVERAMARMGESGMVTAWIDPDKVSTANLEAALAKKVKTNYRLEEPGLIPPSKVTIVRFSSDERRRGIKHLAEHAIDGDVTSVWKSSYIEDPASHPHELVIDLGKRRNIAGFRYLPMRLNDLGQFAKTEFYVSDEPEAFGSEPAAKATFLATKSPQAADCAPPVSGRYVLVRVLSEINGKPNAAAAEIGIVEKSK